MYKTLAFDIDGTLAQSKSPISPEMAELLNRIIKHYDLVLISGGQFKQFEEQVLKYIKVPLYSKVYCFPTSGASCYVWDFRATQLYSEAFSDAEKEDIIRALYRAMDFVGFEAGQRHGQCLEDRGAQLTYSACGQNAPLEVKREFDPTGNKRRRVAEAFKLIRPDYECRLGGTSSLDITRPGINKAYGMRRYMEMTGVKPGEICFMGDAMQPGGNDYPVTEMGIHCYEVRDPEHCSLIIKQILEPAKIW